MRAILVLSLILAAAPAWAKTAKPAKAPAPAATAVATPARTPAGPLGHVHVRLKDGQALDAAVLKYDSYFLSIQNRLGTGFDVPWAEVESVDSQDLAADLSLMRGKLTAEPGPVNSLIQARSGSAALDQALWPGFLLHGAGHRYAGDTDTFVSLAGAELFGVVVSGFGLSELASTSEDGEHRDTSLGLAVGGGAIFALTWFYDLAFAPGAAEKLDRAKGLAFEPTPTGAQLAYRF
jgi:hypothetical protein